MQRWLLIAILAGSLAAFGGIYSWATVPILLATLLVAFIAPRQTFSFPEHSRLLDWALIAIALGIGVQLVPLPPALVDFFSPDASRVRDVVRLDSRMAEDAAYPLSLDPRATLRALLTYLSAVLVFWTARAALASGGARQVCRAVALIAVVLCIESLVQRAVSPSLIYGFWRPVDIGAQPFGPFVNRNHLAGWLAMALPLVAGYVAARVRTRTSGSHAIKLTRLVGIVGPSLLVAMIAMALTLLATFSRSGLLGLGAAFVTAWRLARQRVHSRRNMAVPLLAAAGLILVVLVATVDLDRWTRRFTSTFSATETGRLTIWRESLPAAADFWLAGTGAGTYATAMLVYQTSVVPMPHLRTVAHFNQAHSHYVQVAVEGGVLIALPVLMALAAFIHTARITLSADRGEAVWIRVGALAALAAIATQSVWETALLVPANALMCAVIAGIAVHRRSTGYGDDVIQR